MWSRVGLRGVILGGIRNSRKRPDLAQGRILTQLYHFDRSRDGTNFCRPVYAFNEVVVFSLDDENGPLTRVLHMQRGMVNRRPICIVSYCITLFTLHGGANGRLVDRNDISRAAYERCLVCAQVECLSFSKLSCSLGIERRFISQIYPLVSTSGRLRLKAFIARTHKPQAYPSLHMALLGLEMSRATL